jgi:hypothetical protein
MKLSFEKPAAQKGTSQDKAPDSFVERQKSRLRIEDTEKNWRPPKGKEHIMGEDAVPTPLAPPLPEYDVEIVDSQAANTIPSIPETMRGAARDVVTASFEEEVSGVRDVSDELPPETKRSAEIKSADHGRAA